MRAGPVEITYRRVTGNDVIEGTLTTSVPDVVPYIVGPTSYHLTYAAGCVADAIGAPVSEIIVDSVDIPRPVLRAE